MILILSGTIALHGQPIPGLRNEQRTPVTLTPYTSCSAEVSGQISIGRTTSGGGSLLFKNIGSKPIAALRGVVEYVTTAGLVAVPWTFTLTSISIPAAAYVPPGERTSVPLQPGNITRPEGSILSLAAKITGVLYGDGTTCGEAGENLRSHFLNQLAQAKHDLELVLASAQVQPPEEFERSLKEGILNVPGKDAFNRLMKSRLLDENGRLKPNPAALVKAFIANVDKPFRP